MNKWREIDSLILSSKELGSRSLETDKKITKVCSTKREVKIISLPNSSCLKSERFRTSNFLKILTVDTRSQFQMNIHRHYQRNLTRVFNVCQKCQAILNKGFVLLSAFALSMLLKIWTHGYGFQNIRRFYNYDSFFFNFMKFSEKSLNALSGSPAEQTNFTCHKSFGFFSVFPGRFEDRKYTASRKKEKKSKMTIPSLFFYV